MKRTLGQSLFGQSLLGLCPFGQYPRVVFLGTSPLGLGLCMWKFLAMRIDARICAFSRHISKKNHHFGPIFWSIFDRFSTIFVKNFNRFCARAPAPQFCSIFDLVFFAYYAHTDFVFRIASAYAHMRINPHTSASSASARPSIIMVVVWG